MNKKKLLAELIETERARLNRLIEKESSCDGNPVWEDAGGGDSHPKVRLSHHSEAVYHQSRYVDRLIEIYMMI